MGQDQVDLRPLSSISLRGKAGAFVFPPYLAFILGVDNASSPIPERAQKMRWSGTLLLWALVLLAGCGRYFGGAVQPVAEEQQAPNMMVSDDRSVTYVFERLEIGLKPMSDQELNRQFPGLSNQGPTSTNPYTYGNWKRMGEQWIPPKYSVWRLKVKNYAYPKIQVDPSKIELVSDSGFRTYTTLDQAQILEYYYSHIVGYAGNEYRRFTEREDVLNRTLFKGEVLYSGQEAESFIVFPKLDPDVTAFAINVADIALRFNYRDEPIETTDLSFRFQREVHKGNHPPAEWLSGNQ